MNKPDPTRTTTWEPRVEGAVVPNPELVMHPNGLVRWNIPERRRASFRSLRDLVRYGLTMRAPRVRVLEKDVDPRIGRIERFARLSADDAFSATVVLRDGKIIHERYAADEGPDQLHSIMSIGKTTMAMLVGKHVADGRIDVTGTVGQYVPEIGSAYADATIQQVLDMDWSNDYSEDFSDPRSSVWEHEGVAGWRVLPVEPPTLHDFLASFGGGRPNSSGETDYKDANTDVLAWIVERVSAKPIQGHLLDIAEAAGIEQTLFVGCDRTFRPIVSFCISLTARDLARWGMLLLDGIGVGGERVADPSFIQAATTNRGTRYRLNSLLPSTWRYSNHLMTNGRWVGHLGYAGQWMAVDLQTRTVLVWLSVLESFSGMEDDYHADLYQTADDLFDLLAEA